MNKMIFGMLVVGMLLVGGIFSYNADVTSDEESVEEDRILDCEANKQSNLNCETYPANECRGFSWFR